jgi:hypothetical protein
LRVRERVLGEEGLYFLFLLGFGGWDAWKGRRWMVSEAIRVWRKSRVRNANEGVCCHTLLTSFLIAFDDNYKYSYEPLINT